MASSEKKRAREQNAAARRERVAQKRSEKAALRGDAEGPTSTLPEGAPEQSEEQAPSTERVRTD
jgi:hypothetical protein